MERSLAGDMDPDQAGGSPAEWGGGLDELGSLVSARGLLDSGFRGEPDSILG